MPAVDDLFTRLRQTGRKAFIPFIPAGDPDLTTTAELLRSLPHAGADLIEVGFPFSDPIADGPVIQAAYTRALEQGVRVADVLRVLQENPCEVPRVGMVSYSLVFRQGVSKFLQSAIKARLAGLVVPDLPGEEAATLSEQARDVGLSLILLVTPTTDLRRAEMIARLSSGFLYCVSVAGITGERDRIPESLIAQLQALRGITGLPLCVGFGVSRPDHVEQLKAHCDGVIVGSAIVRRLAEGVPAALALARELSGALR